MGTLAQSIVASEGESQLIGSGYVLWSAARQQVALDQGEQVCSQFVGQGFAVTSGDGAVAGAGVVFCFHRPRVWEMG